MAWAIFRKEKQNRQRSLQEIGEYNVVVRRGYYFVCLLSTAFDRLHLKSITARSLTSAHFFHNCTITIFMRAPADGKTISYFFCGPLHSPLWARFNEMCGGEALRHSF